MHSYTDPGSGALVFVPSPETIEINKLKVRIKSLETLVLALATQLGVDVDALI